MASTPPTAITRLDPGVRADFRAGALRPDSALRVLLVVMAAFSVIASILLFRLLRKPLGEPVAMLAAAFWGLDMTIHATITQQGLETGLVGRLGAAPAAADAGSGRKRNPHHR